jgi:hypothetical protein
MSANIGTKVPARMTRDHILSLLDDLPPESLAVVEQFVRFLREQTRQGRPVVSVSEEKKPAYLYPTIGLSASSLNRWLDLLPEGYEGDALADTEALYDDEV